MNVILFDTDSRSHLLPLTATRPVGELRLGALTIREKWELLQGAKVSFITQNYLQQKFPTDIQADNYLIDGAMVPDGSFVEQVSKLQMNEALTLEGEIVAARLAAEKVENLDNFETLNLKKIPLENGNVIRIQNLWDFIRLNDTVLRDEILQLMPIRPRTEVSTSNRIIGNPDLLFVGKNNRMECCILNTQTGPIFIDDDVEVMEGSMLRGPLYIGSGTIVKLGAKIYGSTTIGPGCRVGGEVTRSILMANSNKGHDGFLGDSVLGEWCNLGADTNNSNLKNNYSEVKLWNYATGRFERSGMQFCGLIMGDHAKCGINTMFNTGTVAGVFANIFGAGYPRNFIPDFSWGGADSPWRTYLFDQACETAATVMARRHIAFSEIEREILENVFAQTAQYRTWEKQ